MKFLSLPSLSVSHRDTTRGSVSVRPSPTRQIKPHVSFQYHSHSDVCLSFLSLPLCGRAPLVHQLSSARRDKSCSIFSRQKTREQRRDDTVNVKTTTCSRGQRETKQCWRPRRSFITAHNVNESRRIYNTPMIPLFLRSEASKCKVGPGR